jgi:hypothetical protein
MQDLNVKIHMIDPRFARQYYLIYREINIQMNNIISQEEKNNIDRVCNEYDLVNYSINSDGSINVDGNVDLSGSDLVHIPLKFNKVSGKFICDSNRLTSLEGCPKYVGGGFRCDGNKLTSLEFCPITVNGFFDCRFNRLTSLENCPREVSGYFYCNSNRLTSLEFCPTEVGGSFSCGDNRLASLEFCPTEVGGDFYCNSNRLTSLEGCPKEVGGDFICSNNRLPVAINKLFNDTSVLSREEQLIFINYQSYYDVWTPEFNIEGMNEFIGEIKDGLK